MYFFLPLKICIITRFNAYSKKLNLHKDSFFF
jgi:hypothetical protein